jgi:hypothetical protein
MNRLSGRLAVVLALGGFAAALPAPAAQAAAWHLDLSFGRRGVAGLPLRERARGTLLAPAGQGSVFVGGYADRRKGAFLIARLSASGKLVKSFGSAGVSTVPSIYAFPQDPPRLFALPGGKLLIVGLDRSDHFAAARLTARGGPDRSFGHNGVARYALRGVHGFAIVTAASAQSNGDIVAVYQKEAAEPVNEPQIPEGLGEGQIELIRLLGGGALDRSFGEGGFLRAPGETPALGGYPGTGAGWTCEQTIAGDGSLLLAYEQAVVPGDAAEVPAVEKLSPTGADFPGFGPRGAVFLPFVPTAGGASSELCDGLFSLPGGRVEAGFGGEDRGVSSHTVELFRFTSSGALDPSFRGSGYARVGSPVSSLAIAPDGETFTAGISGDALVVGGVLAGGTADPALGGSRGRRFATDLSRPGSNGRPQTVELLPGTRTMDIRVGEEVVRISD